MRETTLAVVLCLGTASRLRPLSLACPKTLLPFCGRPLLEYSLEQLRMHGVSRVVLVVGLAEEGFDQLASHSRTTGMEVSVVRRGLEFGSAGVVRSVFGVLHGVDSVEQLLVIYGDSLFRMDLTSLLKSHRRRRAEGCRVTLALHRPDDLVIPGRDRTNYGIARLDKNDRVIEFVEKPPVNNLPSRWANSGVFVLDRTTLNMFPERMPLDFSSDVFSALPVNRLSPLFGFQIEDGYRFDIGTIQDYVRCQVGVLDGSISLDGMPPNQIQRAGDPGCTWIADGISLVGADCRFGKGAVLRGRNIIGGKVSVAEGSELSNCVVLGGTTIGPAARISGAVIGRYCRIAGNVALREGSVLGDFTVIA